MSVLSLKISDLMNVNNIKSEAELAKIIKIARDDLHRFLTSKSKNPDKKILNKIAEFFEVSVDELIQDNRIESIYISENERHHDSPSSVLRYLMKDIGDISEGELFRRTGVPQPTIHRILSGATPNPRMDSLEPLAEFFNVTPDQMLGRIPLPKDRIPGTFVALTETKNIVPLLHWSEIVYWPKILKNPDFKTDRNWITSESKIKGAAFALKIMSTDYLPEFRNGTIIIVDSNRTPKQGDFALGIAKKNNAAVLGQVSREKNNLVLVSFSESYGELIIGRSVDLCGVITEARHQF
jgi:transcriptional regulator with XRE-family HTH domain